MEKYLCVTCGTQYPARASAPEHCPICEDDRQYVNPQGQHWTTLAAEHGKRRNALIDLAPGVTAIVTEPTLGIGERAYLLQTPAGNLLWDCVAYLDDATISAVRARGGVAAISISHPHFYTTMGEWSQAFDNAPIYLHQANEPWVMAPNAAISYWATATFAPLPGMTLLRCGGHFPGSMALHWASAEDGRGALFTGDTIKVVADRRYVTFMYSYPNTIPLDERAVQAIASAVEPYPFTALYDGWTMVAGDAKASVRRSAARYIAHLRGEA